MNKDYISLIIIFLVTASISFCREPPSDGNWYGNFDKRFTIEINNTDSLYLENYPVIIKIGGIKEKIPDFNPYNYVLVGNSSCADALAIPSQVDDLNEDGNPDELVFVYSMKPSSTTTIYCYYSPYGSTAITYPKKADARLNWTDRQRELGWESNWCGYSFFDGRMDFYAKRLEGLQLKRFVTETNYHHMNEWGMDVLVIHNKPGLGGISLKHVSKYVSTVGDSEKNKIVYKRKIISDGPVRALVGVEMKNIHIDGIKYQINIFMSAFADNRYSRQDIKINADGLDTIVFSPGMQILTGDEWVLDSTGGTFSCWGTMDEKIGEIGLGLVFPKKKYAGFSTDDQARYVWLRVPAGVTCTYYTMGAWEKGPENPTLTNEVQWHKMIEELSRKISAQVKIKFKNLAIRTNH